MDDNTSLANIVTSSVINTLFPVDIPNTSTATALFAPTHLPPTAQLPYHILHDPLLAVRMMDSLKSYLSTSLAASSPPSEELSIGFKWLPSALAVLTPLREETTTTAAWTSMWQVIQYCIKEIDQNDTPPVYARQQTIHQQQYSDGLLCPHAHAPPRLHKQDMGWAAFDEYAPSIVQMGSANHGNGTPLEFTSNMAGSLSIIAKMGVSMLSQRSGQLIPYAVLYGGNRFMIFTLFHNLDGHKRIRHGLLCSDIIDITDSNTPFIPLITRCLLGREHEIPLPDSQLRIPAVITNYTYLYADRTMTRRESDQAPSAPRTLQMDQTLRVTFDPPGVSKVFSYVLHAELPPPSGSASPPSSPGPLTLPSLARSDAQVHMNGSLLPVSLLSNVSAAVTKKTSPQTPLRAAGSDIREQELFLRTCIGQGIVGPAYLTALDGSSLVVKLAPFKIGPEMLQREAVIYRTLLPLQGTVIPQCHGLFACNRFKALVLEYAGKRKQISDMTTQQRCALFEKLLLIHGAGVMHGDLKSGNVVVTDTGEPKWIDFSHSGLHTCTGPSDCEELCYARRFLRLEEN